VSPFGLSMENGLTVQKTYEPIIAWRAWALSGHRDGTGLLLRPVAGRARPWKPLEMATAVCKASRFHRSPHIDCTCGLHGTHDPDTLRKARTPAVLGRVALWGRVIEHERGWRAEYAYPQTVRLVCQFCFWHWGVLATPPDLVGWFPRGELVPLCEPHLVLARRYGMVPRDLMAADEVAQRLRDTYAVDQLAY
jgi:hypothetical protein